MKSLKRYAQPCYDKFLAAMFYMASTSSVGLWCHFGLNLLLRVEASARKKAFSVDRWASFSIILKIIVVFAERKWGKRCPSEASCLHAFLHCIWIRVCQRHSCEINSITSWSFLCRMFFEASAKGWEYIHLQGYIYKNVCNIWWTLQNGEAVAGSMNVDKRGGEMVRLELCFWGLRAEKQL